MANPGIVKLSLGVLGTLSIVSAQSWTKLNPAVSPSARKGSGMVYDSFRDRVVLHGMPAETAMPETWEWDRVTWAKRNLPREPTPAREFAAVAYDSLRRRVVLFGGWSGGLTAPPNPALFLADTWEYDGTTWVQRMTPIAPTNRVQSQMAFDARRGRCVLFGGGVAAGVSDETWEWDGSQWMRIRTVTVPPARQSAPLVYDSRRGVTVMFGGLGQGGAYLGGPTWEYDGTDWKSVPTAVTPPATEDHGFAYDSARGRVVMTHGWADPAMSVDTWEYDAVTWTKTTPPVPPPSPAGRLWLGFCHDPVTRQSLLYGGMVFGGAVHQADTWAYTGPGLPSGAYSEFPVGQVTSEGAQHSSAPFAVSGSRLQSILRATGFTGPTRGTIRGLELRANQDTQGFAARKLDLTVSLAFAAKTPQNASPLFANNALPGTGQVVLSSIGMNLPAVQPTPTGPAPFAINLPFASPFSWNGEDLVLEFQSANNSVLGKYELDAAVETLGAGTASTFGTSCSGAIGVSGPVQTIWETKQLVPGGALISLVDNAATSALAVMTVGSSTTQWAGATLPYSLGPCLVHTGLDITGLATTDPTGRSIMVWDLPSVVSGTMYTQWAVADPRSGLGLAFTNAWKVTIGASRPATYDTLEATSPRAVYGMKWPDRYLSPVLRLRL